VSIQWSDVLANIGLAAIIVVASMHVLSRLPVQSQKLKPWLLGLVLGAGAVLSMSVPLVDFIGFRSDLRSAMIALGGYFGGPIGAAVVVVPVIAYRLYLGGAGAFSGIVLTCVTFFVGLAGWQLRKRLPTPVGLVLLAVTVSTCNMVLSRLLLPPEVWHELTTTIVAPLVIATIASILLIGAELSRDEARRSVEQENARYRAMVDALPECLNVKDLDGRFEIANPATAAQLGAASPAEILGKTDADFHPAPVAARLRADELRAIAYDRAITFAQDMILPDGRTANLSTIKAPLRQDGRTVGIITHNRDVTEQHRLQIELDTTRNRLAVALDSMADGLVLVDDDGVIALCNERYRELFPLTAHLRRPGTRFADLLRTAAAIGEEIGLTPTAIESVLASTASPTDGRKIRMGDGRILFVRGRRVPGGGTLSVVSDITEHEHLEAELRYRAAHDALTGVANRRQFDLELARCLAAADSGGAPFALLLIDLDHFKAVNDRHGHMVGDRLLVAVASRIEAELGSGDIAARLGGDEFAAIVQTRSTASAVAELAANIVRSIRTPLVIDGVAIHPGASVGFTLYPRDPGSVEQVLSHADQALYDAKTHGRSGWADYRSHSTGIASATGDG